MRIFFIVLLFLLVSCGQTKKLSKEDRMWMPYKGNETLVFKSNNGLRDTVFLLRKDTLWGYANPALSTKKYEELAIFCKHTDSYSNEGEHRYLKNYFMKIKKTMSGHAEIIIYLSGRNAEFYRLSSIKLDSLNHESAITLKTSSGLYNDVYVFSGEDWLGGLEARTNFIAKLYWSKSSGLIRYDKKDSVYWELSNKY